MKLEKINTLSIAKNAYVLPLTTIHQPPKELYIKGTLPPERRLTVAIVGSRRPTAYGKEATQLLARGLAKRGVVVISGLALGVDAIAHEAALEAGGTTIAVLASGLHTVYPKSNTGLARRIVEKGGAILSEKPPGYEARSYDFLARNRLVSGLADAVIVTEATERSGTLSTVGHALEQNKDVFAVPGPITSLLSVGSNKLLQQGAHVALSAEDVLRILAPELLNDAKIQKKLIFGDTPLETSIIELIENGVKDGEQLQQRCGVEVSEFLRTLTAMELKETVYALGANQWAIRQ